MTVNLKFDYFLLVTLILSYMKIFHAINWSWWVVMAPLLLFVSMVVAFFLIVGWTFAGFRGFNVVSHR